MMKIMKKMTMPLIFVIAAILAISLTSMGFSSRIRSASANKTFAFETIKAIDFSKTDDYNVAGRAVAGYKDLVVCGANNAGNAPNAEGDVSISAAGGVDGSPAILLKDKTARLELTLTAFSFVENIPYSLSYKYKRVSANTGDSFDVQPILNLMNQAYVGSSIVPNEWYDSLNVDNQGSVFGQKTVYIMKTKTDDKITFKMFKDSECTAALGESTLPAATDTIGGLVLTFYTIGSQEDDSYLFDDFVFGKRVEVSNVTPNPKNTQIVTFDDAKNLSDAFTDNAMTFIGKDMREGTGNAQIVDDGTNKVLKLTSEAGMFSNIGAIYGYNSATQDMSFSQYELSFKFKSINGANLMVKPSINDKAGTWLFSASASWTTAKAQFTFVKDGDTFNMPSASLVGGEYNAGEITGIPELKKAMFVFASHTGDYTAATGGVMIDDIQFKRVAPIEDFVVAATKNLLSVAQQDTLVFTEMKPYEPDGIADFTFVSSDTSVVTVSDSGVVTAISSGEATVTITNNEIVRTVNYTIVREIVATAIRIDSNPIKKSYTVGQELDLQGIIIKVVFNDNSVADLLAADYTISGYDKTKVGEQTITITHKTIAALTATFKVTVAAVPQADKKGCGGSIATSSAAVVVILSLVAVVISTKRKKVR